MALSRPENGLGQMSDAVEQSLNPKGQEILLTLKSPSGRAHVLPKVGPPLDGWRAPRVMQAWSFVHSARWVWVAGICQVLC